MNIWAIIYLSLSLIGVGVEIERHNKPKEGKHNVWISLIAGAVSVFILYKAGFFTLL